MRRLSASGALSAQGYTNAEQRTSPRALDLHVGGDAGPEPSQRQALLVVHKRHYRALRLRRPLRDEETSQRVD